MITARNYAAQAEKDLVNYPRDDLPDAQAGFVATIRRAVHFAMPDGGRIFNDNLRGVHGEQIRLPFDVITVEWFDDGPDFKRKVLVSAIEARKEVLETIDAFIEPSKGLVGDTAIIMSVCINGNNKHWDLLPISLMIDSAWDSPKPVEQFNVSTGEFEPIGISGEQGSYAVQVIPMIDLTNEQENGFADEVNYFTHSVLELCEALSCSNVTSDVLQPASPKNAKRISDKKLPIYETRCLSIIVPSTTSSSSCGLGGTHRSPRQHLRRGHIRRIAEDRKIWVNSCVVGAKSQGVIEKTYTVSA